MPPLGDHPAPTAGGDLLDLSLPVERERPRGGRFLVASLAALLGAALVAYGLVALLVAERAESLHDALRARLEALAGGRAEVLATWLDGLARLGERLSESDLVRLYTYETGLSRLDEPLREPLADQTPYMQRLIDDFGFSHEQYPLALQLFITGTSLLWCWIVRRTRSIWAAWGAHMIVDIVIDAIWG
jgi:hypothetical protein